MANMAVLEIRRFGDPVLREKGKKIGVIDADVQKLIDDMIETMHDARGVGLAAPQVGLSIRLTVIEVPDHEPYILINPEIVKRSGKRVVTEGCLSLPGWYGEVTRSERVVARAKNRYGKEYKIVADELLAQALEHEIDHLNGVLFVDHLTAPDKLWKSERSEDQSEERKSEETSEREVSTSIS